MDVERYVSADAQMKGRVQEMKCHIYACNGNDTPRSIIRRWKTIIKLSKIKRYTTLIWVHGVASMGIDTRKYKMKNRAAWLIIFSCIGCRLGTPIPKAVEIQAEKTGWGPWQFITHQAKVSPMVVYFEITAPEKYKAYRFAVVYEKTNSVFAGPAYLPYQRYQMKIDASCIEHIRNVTNEEYVLPEKCLINPVRIP